MHRDWGPNFLRNMNAWKGQLNAPRQSQVDNTVDFFYNVAKTILGGETDPKYAKKVAGFDELHPFDQYRFIDDAIGVVAHRYGKDDSRYMDLQVLRAKAVPSEIKPVGSFAATKLVFGPLSDDYLIKHNRWHTDIGGLVVVGSDSAFPRAEEFRQDNSKGHARLYLCDNTKREFERLDRHYGKVALLR